nr:G2:mitotic specific cyclin B3 [Hymenolepis microstoma]
MYLNENKENASYVLDRAKGVKNPGLFLKVHKGLRGAKSGISYNVSTRRKLILRSARHSLSLKFGKLALENGENMASTSHSIDNTSSQRSELANWDLNDVPSNSSTSGSRSVSKKPNAKTKLAKDNVMRLLTNNHNLEEILLRIRRTMKPDEDKEPYKLTHFLRYLGNEMIREKRDHYRRSDFLVNKHVDTQTRDMLCTIADWMIGLSELFPLTQYVIHLAWDIFLCYLEAMKSERKFDIAYNEREAAAKIPTNWLSNSAKIAVQTAIKLADIDPQIIDPEHDNSNLYDELNFYTYVAEEKAFFSTIKFNFLWPSDVVFLDEFLEVLDSQNEKLKKMCSFLLDVGMHNHELSLSKASKKAAAVLWLGRCVLNNPTYRIWRAQPKVFTVLNLIDSNPDFYESLIASDSKELENTLPPDQLELIISMKDLRELEGDLKPLWSPLLEAITTYSESEIIPMALKYHKQAFWQLAETVKYREVVQKQTTTACSLEKMLKFPVKLKRAPTVTKRPVSTCRHTLRWSVFSRHRSLTGYDVPTEYLLGSLKYLVPNYPLVECPPSCQCLVCSNLLRFHRISQPH